MLPTSTVPHRQAGRAKIFFPSSTREPSPSRFWQTLRTRARLTNFGVSILVGVLVTSLLLNLYHYSGGGGGPGGRRGFASGGRPGQFAFSAAALSPVRAKGWEDVATSAQYEAGIPLSIETTVERDARFAALSHLVMVPGHAIWIGNDPHNVENDDDWILEGMQKGGSVKTYVKHIKEGVEIMKRDTEALLIFSGGATRRPPSPPLPEGLSYLFLATALDLLPSPLLGDVKAGHDLPLSARAVTEEFALDSYENLLFSVARFKEVTGLWPTKITVVGYGMKSRRFDELHRAAIGFPADAFHYVGIDDEGDTTEHYAGELKYGYTPFLSSPSGCHPPLSFKRQLRNPYSKYHPYHTSCPEIVELLEWCPVMKGDVQSAQEMEVYPGPLPWNVEGRSKSRIGAAAWSREKD